MTDRELLAIIDQEAESAIGADSQSELEREKMLAFYSGEAKDELAPPAVDGRSRVVSKDMMDTVEWMMPSLMRMFASSDDVIRFQPQTEQDEQAVNDATEYCSYLLFRKNEGFRVLHDAIKNALIQRQSATKSYCDHSWDQREERYEGVSPLELEALSADPDVEIVELLEAEPVEGQQGAESAYTVVCRRRVERKQIRVVGVPPEELRFNKDARSIDEARFVQHRTDKTISDLISLGYDPVQVRQIPTGDDTNDLDDGRNTDLTPDEQVRMDEALKTVELCETYIKVDYDGDGIAEFRRVVHAGKVIFENTVTDDHPFALFTPILMPYKAVGLGIFDLVEDLQRIRTFLTRSLLDNAGLANNPRNVVVDGQVNLDDLLNPRVGGIIRAKSLDAMRTEITPFVGGQVLTLLDHFGQVRDKRTGVTEFNQGLGADSLSKTEVGSEGAQAMMDAAMQRVELVARVLAETGVKRMYRLILKNAVQYVDREEEVKVNGRWLRVNPREWNTGYDTEVTIGTGHNNQQQKLRNLSLIGQVQRELHQLGLVSPQNAYNVGQEVIQACGYRDADRFISPPGQMPQDKGPPPEVMLEQMKQQGAQALEQVKAQAAMQVEQMRAEVQMRLAQAEQEAQAQQDTLRQQLEHEREQQKLAADMELERYREEMKRETAITIARINAEGRIASSLGNGVKDGPAASAELADQDSN